MKTYLGFGCDSTNRKTNQTTDTQKPKPKTQTKQKNIEATDWWRTAQGIWAVKQRKG